MIALRFKRKIQNNLASHSRDFFGLAITCCVLFVLSFLFIVIWQARNTNTSVTAQIVENFSDDAQAEGYLQAR